MRRLGVLGLVVACTGPTVGPGLDGGVDAGDGASDAGDGAIVLAGGRDCPADLRVHQGVVIWVDQGSLQNNGEDGVLATVPAAGCDGGACVTELATEQRSPSAVEIDPFTKDIYWATLLDDTIWRLRSQTTTPEAVAAGQNWPRSLAVDITALYWANRGSLGNGDGEIRRMFLDDGTPGGAPIVSAVPSPQALTVLGDYVYWTNYGNFENYFDGTIWRAKRDGTEVEQLLSALSSPSDIAVDALGVYWVEMGTPDAFQDGKVMGARLDGSEITPIATGQHAPRRIEVDADAVYWLNRGTTGLSAGCSQHDGAVMRATRPW
jgi:hypothetical protein